MYNIQFNNLNPTQVNVTSYSQNCCNQVHDMWIERRKLRHLPYYGKIFSQSIIMYINSNYCQYFNLPRHSFEVCLWSYFQMLLIVYTGQLFHKILYNSLCWFSYKDYNLRGLIFPGKLHGRTALPHSTSCSGPLIFLGILLV